MSWRDIAARVDAAGVEKFGETVSYTPAGDVARDITAAFDAATEILEMVDGFQVYSKVPTLGVHLPALGFTPRKGDLVTVDGTDYEVSEPPDFDGPGAGARLRLQTVDS